MDSSFVGSILRSRATAQDVLRRIDSYKQFTLEQRYVIYSLFKTGHNQTEIAAVIGVHKSTISRELRRNHGERGYRYKHVHHTAVNRRKDKVPFRIDGTTWAMIESLICEDWSPEQIAGWMKLEMDISVHQLTDGFITTSWWINNTVVICIVRQLPDAGKRERSGMAPMTDGERLETRSGNCLMNVRLLSRQRSVLETGLPTLWVQAGKQIPLLVSGTNK